LPLELYDLSRRFTATTSVLFAINLGLVLYLVITKRLFGVRGGKKAYDARLWSESILEAAEVAAARRVAQAGASAPAGTPVSASAAESAPAVQVASAAEPAGAAEAAENQPALTRPAADAAETGPR